MCREDALKVREDNRKLEQEKSRLQAASVSRLKAFEAEIGCMCVCERKRARAHARARARERERERVPTHARALEKEASSSLHLKTPSLRTKGGTKP